MMTNNDPRPQQRTFVLIGNGATLTLDIIAATPGSTKRTLYFGGTARIETGLTMGPVVFESTISGIVGDLLRLSDWIHAHVTALVAHHATRTGLLVPAPYPQHAWVPLELGIQIECLGGDVWQEADALVGDFTMRIMVLAGRGGGNSPIYAGIEIIVDARRAVEFATSLRDFISDIT